MTSDMCILRASWHVVTVFGWCITYILLRLSFSSVCASLAWFMEQAIIIATLAGSALVFIGTRARHLGWAGLLGIAVLVWLVRVR